MPDAASPPPPASPPPASPFDLAGRVAFVTGGNGGIGRAVALALARAGASVVVAARNEAKNAAVLAELQAIGRPCMALRLDLLDRGAIAPAVAEAERTLGPIDVLVNNAGIAMPSGGVLKESSQVWDATIETHLTSCFLMSQAVARSMALRRSGKIINLASMYSIFGSGALPSYSAAKGGVVQLTKSMAIELAKHDIQVNAVAPGWIDTDMTSAAIRTPMGEAIVARTPAGRWGLPQDVAGAVVFLASPASDFVTGVTLPVDGGYSIR